MIRKTQTTAMKEEAKPALVPKLRFPEFREADGWEKAMLGDLMEITSSKRVHESDWAEVGVPFYRAREIVSLNKGEPITPLFISEDLYRENARKSGEIVPGDLLVSGVGSIGIPYLVKANDRFYFKDGNIIWLKNRDTKLQGQFLLTLYGTQFVQSQIKTMAGVGTVGTYTIDNANKTVVVFPVDDIEQQKIADCLSTVDELMAAQARKVEALKTHKKGLMQQLFPREGETQPRLRFPEFRNEGEWVEQPLSNLCDIKHGYAFESEFFSNEGEYVLLTPGNFYEEGGYRDRGNKQKYYSGEIPRDYVRAEGDMLVAMTEQAAGLLGSPLIVPKSEKFLHNQRLGLVARKPGVAWANEFFFHVFNTQRVRKAIHNTASGAKVRHTSPTKIGEVVVSVPTSSLEQQRIASCLSSLDALITAETQKHEALKTHKKGLMQQLFPSPEETTDS
jgi:type I restriction enzyme S subunit